MDSTKKELKIQDIPLHMDVHHSVHSIDYGDIQFSVTVHNGKVTTYTAHQQEEHKFQNNADAVASIMQYIRDHIQEKASGEYVFTLLMREGEVKLVVINKREKRVYDNS